MGVANITADSPSDALAKGNAAISVLVYKYGPMKIGTEEEPMWICVYQDPNSKIGAVAVTPTLTPEFSKMVKIMHRK